jgi:hypothetical protein
MKGNLRRNQKDGRAGSVVGFPLFHTIAGREPSDTAPVWNMLRMEALQLPAGQASHQSETNLDDGKDFLG